ncbi:MAG TPA: hypothetical protein VF755_29460 [Catenuloplanes sp.]
MTTQSPEIVAVSSTNRWIHQYVNVSTAIADHLHPLADSEFFDTAGRRLEQVKDDAGKLVDLRAAGQPDPDLIDERFRAVIRTRRRDALSAAVRPQQLADGRVMTSAATMRELTIAEALSPAERRLLLLGEASTGPRTWLARIGRRVLGRPGRLTPEHHLPPIGLPPVHPLPDGPPWHVPSRGGWLHMLICHPFGSPGQDQLPTAPRV